MLCEFCHNKEWFTNVINVCHSASSTLTQSLPDTSTFWGNPQRWGDMPEHLLVQVLDKQLFWFCEVSWDGYLGQGWLQKTGFITRCPAISLCSEFSEAWKSRSTLPSICGGQQCRWTVLFRALVAVQSLSHVQFFAPAWLQHARLSCPSLCLGVCSNSSQSVTPSNHLILCCPLLLLSSVFPSIRVFSNESALCIRWTKYWSFSISLSNEYLGSWNKPGSGKRMLGEPGSWSLEKQGPEVLMQTYLFNQDSSTIF